MKKKIVSVLFIVTLSLLIISGFSQLNYNTPVTHDNNPPVKSEYLTHDNNPPMSIIAHDNNPPMSYKYYAHDNNPPMSYKYYAHDNNPPPMIRL
ncbi:hypothetical protein ACSVDE_17895 [Pseudalkalibacillus sp. Hm43]|uniref:hypothetical protein n=1 Tax=Pseudalkalibacillus sp. Hm43 TaxID=3450742 RepID=UPI003F433D19